MRTLELCHVVGQLHCCSVRCSQHKTRPKDSLNKKILTKVQLLYKRQLESIGPTVGDALKVAVFVQVSRRSFQASSFKMNDSYSGSCSDSRVRCVFLYHIYPSITRFFCVMYLKIVWYIYIYICMYIYIYMYMYVCVTNQ